MFIFKAKPERNDDDYCKSCGNFDFNAQECGFGLIEDDCDCYVPLEKDDSPERRDNAPHIYCQNCLHFDGVDGCVDFLTKPGSTRCSQLTQRR